MSKLVQYIIDILRASAKFRGRDRAIKFLLSYVAEVESFYGPRLTVQDGDNTFYASYFARYGHELPDLIYTLQTDGIFIDFGSNTGVFSLIAAHHLEDGDVISVEPNSSVFRQLINNRRINEAFNMRIFNFTIGLKTALIPFTFDASHTGKGHIASDDTTANDHITFICADEFAKLLPDLSGRNVLCKIDTEGAELIILQALKASKVIDSIDQIYVEIDSRYLAEQGHKPEEIYVFMDECGFVPLTDRRGQKHYDEIFGRVR